jgi:hypothetical protein
MKSKDTSRAEVMRRHIEACKENKQTVTSYCKENQLVPSNFYYWQKRLRSADANPVFTQLFAAATDTAAIIIHYPNGVRIAFNGGASIAVLKELICCI